MHEAAPGERRLPTKIRAPHKGQLFLDMIEQPIALLQTLHGNLFHLRNCVKVQLQVNTPPTLLTEGQYILNSAVAVASSHSQRLLRWAA